MRIISRDRHLKLATLLLVWLLSLFMGAGVHAQETGEQSTLSGRSTIRVGYFALEAYHEQDESGVRSGYGYDFLKMAEGYQNWKYKYVGYEKKWSDMLDMLDSGDIDMVTFAAKTPEREQKYEFSDSSIGIGAIILSVREGDTRYMVGDTDSYDGMRVGIIRGTTHEETLKAFVQSKGFTYSPVYFSSMEEMKQELLEGNSIDGMVSSSLRPLYQELVLEEMDPQDFYVIVKKGNTGLMEQINYAIAQMDLNNPGWRLTLKKKYFTAEDDETIVLNKVELEFLQRIRDQNVVFRVATNPDMAPYSYFEDGEAKGIVPDIFREVASRIGLQYEFIVPQTYAEYNQLILEGGADIDLTCFSDYGLAEFHGIDLTASYMSTSMALLTLDTFDGELTSLAELQQSEKNTTYGTVQLDSVTQRVCETTGECINAIRSGKADGMYLYTYSAQMAVEQDVKNRLMYVIMPEYSVELSMGVRDDIDYRLLTILNEGIRSVRGRYAQNVIQQQLSDITEQESVISLIYDYPELALIMMLILLLIVFMAVLLLIRIRNSRRMRLQKQALADALETARSASAAKGQFLSKMSHEIRTPLNAVIGYMSIASEAQDNLPKLMHCIENSDIAAKHLLSIINDVLDISSIESGKMKIANEEFDLSKQLTSVTAIFFNQAREKKVRFDVRLKGITEEWVVGDSLRVNQVLMNLLSNAVKFTPEEGNVVLTVTQMGMDEQKVYMKFEVSDSGIGMSEEYQKKLFQPFEQESAATAQKYGGTGLGLSITRNLVTMMGGSVDVKSQLGEGTTFAVSLYFGRCRDMHENMGAQQDYSHVRVLVVDDDESSCEYMKELLKRCGVKCDIVNNGEMAVKQLRRRAGTEYQYDICIMDWNMPELNGIETAERIKQVLPQQMPIIIATAYDVSEFETEAKKAGISKIIAKPLFQSTLFDLLVSTFGKYDPAGGGHVHADLTGIHILLAEDNEMNMEIAVDILSKAGIIVDQATDGQQAAEKFISQPEGTYDVVLMDIQMPVMDGYQATAAIRTSKHPHAAVIPIIAMTANAFAEDVTAALAAGMNDHIAKPIDYDKLFGVLAKFRRIKECVQDE